MNNGMKTFYARRGMVSAPHGLATQSGVAVLREGGNALEAGVAVAAALTVLCPHACGLGGDSLWLVAEADKEPFVINGCGHSAAAFDAAWWKTQSWAEIPLRGAASAVSMAGAVSAWQTALHYSRYQWHGRLPLTRLLADAVEYADQGFVVTPAYHRQVAAYAEELRGHSGFAETFLPQGRPPEIGSLFRQSRLGASLRYLSEAGLWNFYREALAHSSANDLHALGSPLSFEDFHRHQANIVKALRLPYQNGWLYAPDNPAQGLNVLLTLGLFMTWRSTLATPSDSAYIHMLSEAAKVAFAPQLAKIVKNIAPNNLLDANELHRRAACLDPQQSQTWPAPLRLRESALWFGVMDEQGRSVSVMHTLGSAFGSGTVLSGTGICWNNRGAAFTLAEGHPHCAAPLRQAPTALTPVLGQFSDGRCLALGAAGGDMPALLLLDKFVRVLEYGEDPQTAINAPYFLAQAGALWLEPGYAASTRSQLESLGHVVGIFAPEQAPGHSALLLRQHHGRLCAAADGRGDGSAAGY
jgi:oxamate amidohydrolase